jgi:hypothetical protein
MLVEDKTQLGKFLEACSISIGDLTALAEQSGIEMSDLESVIGTKRTAPSLVAITKGKSK